MRHFDSRMVTWVTASVSQHYLDNGGGLRIYFDTYKPVKYEASWVLVSLGDLRVEYRTSNSCELSFAIQATCYAIRQEAIHFELERVLGRMAEIASKLCEIKECGYNDSTNVVAVRLTHNHPMEIVNDGLIPTSDLLVGRVRAFYKGVF